MALPIETWDNIFQSLDTRDKLALATTCSLLHPIAKASLWRNIQLYIHTKSTKHRLIRTLATKPALGALVHDLEIWFCYGVDDPVGSCDAARTLLRRLSSLCNLRLLRVTGFMVDATFCAIVAQQWSQVSTITFDRCIATAADSLQGLFSDTLLTGVRIINPRSMEGWEIVAHPKLRTWVFESDYDFSWITTKCTAFSPPMSWEGVLTELVLNGSFEVDLAPFLRAAPNLKRLTLPRTCRDIELPQVAFKYLEYIAGDADLVAPFVCGRPVRAVHLILRRRVASDVLHLLDNSTALVTELELENKGAPWDLAAMMEHAPASLCSLSLTDVFSSASEASTVSLLLLILKRQPNLTVLSLTGLWWGCALEQQILCNLFEEFPKLREATFDYGEKLWQRGDSGWTLARLRRPSYDRAEKYRTVVSDRDSSRWGVLVGTLGTTVASTMSYS